MARLASLRRLSTLASDVVKPSPPSRFAATPRGPEDAILGITLAYNADPNPNKVNLGVGAYRDDAGLPVVLEAVRQAEHRILQRSLDMEYLPVAGSHTFLQRAIWLAYGDDVMQRMNGRFAGLQTLSGTGACRMAGELISRFLDIPHRTGKPLILLPDPSWLNHRPIFTDAGCKVASYSYYNPLTKSLDIDACLHSLENAPNASVVLLHACAHNPTGVDPNMDQWAAISNVMLEKSHLPLFDMAYQGFTSGDMDVDAASVRLFAEDGHKIVLAQSFSKNFGLYGQRVGCLSVMTDSEQETQAINSQLKIIARPMYSNPPIAGVRLVEEVLNCDDLQQLWRSEMKSMAHRIISMRSRLRQHLIELGNKHNWDHIVNQHGMFCFSGLSKEQVDTLRERFSVYLTANGRISMAGVTSDNVDYLADAIHHVTSS
uniref:Aspartate aminotransferase n=1 Tax=Gracilaria vermiculophylla TaxID=2608709 RepID=A0A097IUZ2_9FLOR|nr:aspartate aminotransferase [Gracilaria vermiculophylla]